MVGLFVFFAIGIAVVKDIWEVLDIQTSGVSHVKNRKKKKKKVNDNSYS